MKISFDVPDEYPWIVLACLVLCIEAFFASLFVVKARAAHFPNEFMKENFGKLHKETYPGEIARPLGFPDIGYGRYSDKLSYKGWIEFNNVVRSHLNIVEQINFLLVIFMIGGLILPKLSMVLAWLGVIGRAIYIIGYVVKGANGRLFGAFFNLIPNYFTTFTVLIVLIVASIKNAGNYFSPATPVQ